MSGRTVKVVRTKKYQAMIDIVYAFSYIMYVFKWNILKNHLKQTEQKEIPLKHDAEI